MIRLFERSGSSEIQLLDQSLPGSEWDRLKKIVVAHLDQRTNHEAAELLRKHPFVLYEGTNGFEDEFTLLYMQAPRHLYIELAEMVEDQYVRGLFYTIAETVTDIIKPIRFIAVDLETTEGPEAVAPPLLEITSDVVERALRDAEKLISTEGAISGVDRVHTAFHGYLRAITNKVDLTVSDKASITVLFKSIRKHHPSFQQPHPRQADIDKIMRSLANIVDALNPVRNRASVAHPNETLLEEPEAMLVINSVRSLLHYLNSRART